MPPTITRPNGKRSRSAYSGKNLVSGSYRRFKPRESSMFTISVPKQHGHRRKSVLIKVSSAKSIKERFDALATEWKDEVEFLSSPSEMAALDSYQQIIRLGNSVVPFVLNELKREPNLWFSALRALTHCDPVSPNIRGDVAGMSLAWLLWGQSSGLVKIDEEPEA